MWIFLVWKEGTEFATLSDMQNSPSIYNLSNILSLLRGPLILVYIFGNAEWKIGSLVLAGLSDFLDGYLARKLRTITKLGAYLDALMDKFFVFCVAGFLVFNGDILPLNFIFFISRDLFLSLLILYLVWFTQWRQIEIRSAFLGKTTTAFQLLTLIGVTLQFSIPQWIYYGFLALGFTTIVELIIILKKRGELNRF